MPKPYLLLKCMSIFESVAMRTFPRRVSLCFDRVSFGFLALRRVILLMPADPCSGRSSRCNPWRACGKEGRAQ
jgi:hypothetical protein